MKLRNQELRRHLGYSLYGKPLRRRPRIGFLGFQGNPPHYGHLSSTHLTRIKLKLDRVLWITCNESPNKKDDPVGPQARHDYNIAATAGNPFFMASDIDLRMKGTSYMINSVESIIAEYGDDCDLFALISSEYLNPDFQHTLSGWTGAKELFTIKQLTFAVFPRDQDDVETVKKWARMIPQAKIIVLDIPSMPISSTMIRDWVGKGQSIWYTTPWAVQKLIAKNERYLIPGIKPYSNIAPSLSQVQRVAVFPGAFDPPTYKDMLRGKHAQQIFDLHRVCYVTSGSPADRRTIHAPGNVRHEMVVAFTAEDDFYDAWATDVDCGRIAYTLQTVEEAERRFPTAELFTIINAAFLNPAHPYTLSKWMGASDLFRKTRFIAFVDQFSQLERAMQWAARIPNAKIDVIYAPTLPVGSDYVRDLVASGHSTLYCTSYEVNQIIKKHGVYGADQAPRLYR